MVDLVGQQLSNYRIVRLLGQGGFGDVYLGEHTYLKSPAAIKVLHTALSDEHKASFLTEAQHLMRLRHPHIVRFLEFGFEGDLPFLIMEYAPNGTLRTRHPRGTRVPLETIVAYVKQVADALQYLHEEKLVHRDVKPDNMLLGPRQEVLLSDLGVVAVAHHSESMVEQGQAGTAVYMAPEQIMQTPRPASDQYALGVVVYEWLCGTPPFQGTLGNIVMQHLQTPPPSLQARLPTISAAVEMVVLKSLAKEPKQRFARVADFAQELEQAIKVPDSHAAASFWTPSAQPPSREKLSDLSSLKPAMPLQSDRMLPSQDHSLVPPASPPSDNAIADSQQPRLSNQMSQAPSQLPPPVMMPPQGTEPPIVSALSYQEETSQGALLPPHGWPSQSSTPSLSSPPLTPPAHSTSSRGLFTRKVVLLALAALILVGSTVYFVPQWLSATGGSTNHPATPTTPHPTTTQNTPNTGSTAMFGFNPTHIRFNPDEKILSVSNVSQLRLDWTATTGDDIDSEPAVANGVVYVSSVDHKLYAFKADGCGQANCAPLWTATTGDNIFSSPAVANGVVYVGSNDAKLYAFRADGCGQANCAPLWTATTGSIIFSSPAVANGVVYVGCFDHKLYTFHLPGTGT